MRYIRTQPPIGMHVVAHLYCSGDWPLVFLSPISAVVEFPVGCSSTCSTPHNEYPDRRIFFYLGRGIR